MKIWEIELGFSEVSEFPQAVGFEEPEVYSENAEFDSDWWIGGASGLRKITSRRSLHLPKWSRARGKFCGQSRDFRSDSMQQMRSLTP